MIIESNINQYNIKYYLFSDVISVITTVEECTKYIHIRIKDVFNPKKYILKNIKRHSTLEEIFKKMGETEVSEIKKIIENIAIENYSHKYYIEDIENLKIKR